ncbi:hypothetical protein BKA64DRAFT_651127 [Cadophora sp. MPI-SDFR-AT-0126]|nr:hypothetical protein BKA64DRAFT_651127 [Leotiomycetes sp. MPI-SDFR-AT-0126]
MSDEGYRKVCEHTAEHTGEFIRGNFAFEDHEGLLADRIAASTVTGVTPPYVQRIFEMYPDILETGGGLRKGDETYILGGQGVRKQRLMLVVIDKRACRTGAVLLLGIDDFGQMVPQRLRVKPGDVHQLCANWEDGQRLDENFCEGEDGEVDWFLGESAWISPFTRLCSDEHRAREL